MTVYKGKFTQISEVSADVWRVATTNGKRSLGRLDWNDRFGGYVFRPASSLQTMGIETMEEVLDVMKKETKNHG